MASRQTSIIPKAPVGRIILNAGAKRVSADAMDAFSDIVQQIAEKIGTDAVRIAKHAGRKTIHEEDIKLAAR
ncbi:MAG TPA: histone family protein [Candidatus Nanoarchaeia archaeon]|nr:histone family protein [Candidatus Nanoarchaeia archaeon]